MSGEPQLESLLGRSADRIRAEDFAHYIAGATVLITGAAGSLGSELARRLTRLDASAVVLVDTAEGPLVERATALSSDDVPTHVVPVLADVRSAARTVEVLDRYRPEIVFHAASYKHVPLLEAHPVEAVATNLLGTKNMVEAACAFEVERFVFFSTDKAVRATNVLGTTKAVAEWVVAKTGAEVPGSGYSSIRLANVVDARGGILPRFRAQIACGGPVTVTDPRTTRLLMTSEEAVELAIVAGAVGGPDNVYWADVGPPVRILDFARQLVEAASDSIEIDFVGLRPGENLHEELFAEDEPVSTACERVFTSALPRVDPAWLDAWTSELERLVERASTDGVRNALAHMRAAPEREAAAPAAGVA